MNKKQTLGIVLMLAGVAMLFASNYISTQVGEGKQKIDRAQSAVNKGNGLFSLTPATEGIGRGLTGSAQRKIDAGRQEVGYYEQMASRLQFGGIACIVVGGVLFILGRKKREQG